MPYNNIKIYPYGSRLRHICRVEVNGDATDPTTLLIYFIDPTGLETGPFTPSRDAQGRYEYQRTYTAAIPSQAQGLWTTFWRGTGSAEGATVRQFMIQPVANLASSV